MSPSKKTQPLPDIGCMEAIEGLYAWLDGELKSPQSATHIEDHISHCQSCFTRAETEKLLTERIRKSVKKDPDEQVTKALQNRLRKLMNQI